MDSGTDIWSLLRRTSRTFALSIEVLPRGLRDEMAVAYLLFRVSDYLEDHETLSAQDKIDLLGRWHEVLQGDRGIEGFVARVEALPHRPDDPEAEVALRCDMLMGRLATFPPAARCAILERVRETTRGMARWQEAGPRIPDEEGMDDYMHHVAGLVGFLVTDLVAQRVDTVARLKRQLMPLAREFGLALQTVNIIRGLKKDNDRGWIYVPESLCLRHGVGQSELFRGSRRPEALRVVEDLVTKAERHLHAGLAYICLLPARLHRIRLACLWPLLFAAKTLAVSRNNCDVLTGEVKIGRDTVKRIIRKTTLLGWSNAWLRSYSDRLLRGR